MGDSLTAIALPGVAYAEANWGRWIARCPRPWCTNAMRVDLDQAAFRCEGLGGCGLEADIAWPPDPAAIEILLLQRPVPRTRNWMQGESLEQLLAENAAHGVLPPEWTAELPAGESRAIADIVEQRVVGGLLLDQLAAADPRREIGA